MRYLTSRMIEIIVAVSVVIISVASLFVAVHQSIVMERTLAASVWPIMEFEHGNVLPGPETSTLYLELRNSGIGPAQVRRVSLFFDGDPVASPLHVLARCCAPDELSAEARVEYVGQLFLTRRLVVITDVVEGRVFAPQQRVFAARLDRPTDEAALAVWQSFDRARHKLSAEICYCSVFEECWVGRFPEQTRQPVERCEPA